jgi:hypothetical protein
MPLPGQDLNVLVPSREEIGSLEWIQAIKRPQYVIARQQFKIQLQYITRMGLCLAAGGWLCFSILWPRDHQEQKIVPTVFCQFSFLFIFDQPRFLLSCGYEYALYELYFIHLITLATPSQRPFL